jgi:hypothetical protein
MNPTPSVNETPEDPELLREVYKALKSCGRLLPETVEEVREAERALEEDPIEIPEELLDPLRIFASFSDAQPNSESARVPAVEYPPIPSGLARLAHEENFSQALTFEVLGLHSQILCNRSASKSDEISYEDWKKFYLGVKDYL